MIKQSFRSNEGTKKRQIFYISQLTSGASSLGYVSIKMANPRKLALLPNTVPAEKEGPVSTTHLLTSIPCRSLRKVSTKIARPTKWSWFPKIGPK